MPTLTYKVERLTSGSHHGDETLSFFIRPGSVRRPWKFFRPDEVPAFEGRVAWFEIERTRGQWRFVRQVDPNARRRLDP